MAGNNNWLEAVNRFKNCAFCADQPARKSPTQRETFRSQSRNTERTQKRQDWERVSLEPFTLTPKLGFSASRCPPQAMFFRLPPVAQRQDSSSERAWQFDGKFGSQFVWRGSRREFAAQILHRLVGEV